MIFGDERHFGVSQAFKDQIGRIEFITGMGVRHGNAEHPRVGCRPYTGDVVFDDQAVCGSYAQLPCSLEEISSTTISKSAPSRSILLTKHRRGT